MNDSNNSKSGISFTGALQIAFIVLKLCKVIKWSWLWVLTPTWVVIGVVIILSIVYLIMKWRK